MSIETTRRSFLASTAVAGAAMSLPAASYASIAGANEKKNIAFLGVGGRCQQHVDVVLQMQAEGKPVTPFAVCDVWDGDEELGSGKGRGLYPTAERCKIPKAEKSRVSKDYRELLDHKDVDVACIATPDHWHARMAIDAMNAKKDVYCEKPMTRTIAEAQALVDTWKKTGQVMTVGVQSMADPTWTEALKYIQAGNIGKVLQGQTSYYRNSSVGQWRYYPLKKEMTPKTIDWKRWLGNEFDVDGVKLGPTAEEQPFDRAVWAQWRCYWPFGGGMFTDLFVHQTTHMLQAMGLKYPGRVVGGGGIYIEYDGRDVPDTATVVADYHEGCQFLVSATMGNDEQLGEMIRGHLGTIKFNGGGDYIDGFSVYGQTIAGGPVKPGNKASKPVYEFKNPMKDSKNNATYGLWSNFLECVSARKQETLCTPEQGAAAFSTVNMGVLSYRNGKVLYWDKDQRKEVEADGSWSENWEERSKKHGKPSHINGWTAGDKGSLLDPPDYQKLEGPWINGKDPAKS